MRLRVYGAESDGLRKILRRATKFYGELLMSKQKLRHLDVKLFITEYDRRLFGETEATWEDRLPKEFIIRIPRRGTHTILKTLAHEMVHVKQYATGELRGASRADQAKWHGEVMEDTNDNYWDTPWELEAFGKEFGLYHKFVTAKKRWNKHELSSSEN